MQAGRRRRRRPHLPVSPAWAALSVVVLLIAVAIGLAVWRVLPLTDRGAGVIPPSALTGIAPVAPSGSGAVATGSLTAKGVSTKAIPGVHLAAGVVVDSTTGRVLWAHHPHLRRPVASLTKLMTALLVAQHGVHGRFTVTPAMTGEQGYTIGLHVGDRVRVRDMLAAMLIASANDAADALAVHRSGSLDAFVHLMNREAHHMKLSDTRYSNPSGIVDAGNHSSAWDIADLSRDVLAKAPLRRLVALKFYRPASGGPYVNGNQLLWNYPDATGIKTGQTALAGNCLVASATRNGHTIIAVELGVSGDQFASATHMLDWGFRRARR
jgi:serine-type D-Ala-D-Ala carboxypeptidase (penicillin-binding protein 5/6)